jgi:hypothetical protein
MFAALAGRPVTSVRRFAGRALPGCCLGMALVLGSCSQPVDLKQTLEMTDMSSGWFDAGVVNGRNKIVPSATFRLRKKTPADFDRVSVNALFRAADGKESELDNDVFVQRVDFPSEQTESITIRANNGYTAEPPQSRADMLKHSQFRDMRVQVLVKVGSSQWTDLGWIDIKRQLLTH